MRAREKRPSASRYRLKSSGMSSPAVSETTLDAMERHAPLAGLGGHGGRFHFDRGGAGLAPRKAAFLGAVTATRSADRIFATRERWTARQ